MLKLPSRWRRAACDARGADGAAQIIDLMKSEKKARLTHDQFKDKNKAALEELGALARAPAAGSAIDSRGCRKGRYRSEQVNA